MNDRWSEVSSWFERVCDLPREEGASLLERECLDSAVRAEVFELLDAATRAAAVLEPSSSFREALGGGLDGEEKTVGPYRLEALVGVGGMGSVWRAVRSDGKFTQTVAVKIVKRGLDTDQVVRRFRRERQVLADLEHPSIARLIDGGATDDGRPYLVMEYIDGNPIDVFCWEHKLALKDRLKLVISIAAAVQVAHGRGVVHRDLKPGNILVKGDGTAKLLDFGIAKLLAEESTDASILTETGQRLLTPRYASPEQVRGDAITPATDVYALGVLLFELLTGRSPHDLRGISQTELERAICLDDATRPSLAAPKEMKTALKGDLDLIILRALSKEPDRRYASAADLAEDLRRHIDGRPIHARSDTIGYRAAKFLRRNKILVGAALAVFLALAAGLAVALDQFSEAQRARVDAEFQAYAASLAAADSLRQSGSPRNARHHLEKAPEPLRGWEYEFLDNALDRSLWQAQMDGAVHSASFSRDGRFVALGAQGKVPILDARTGETIRILDHGTSRIRALAFSPDSSRIIAGSSNGVAKLWSVETAELLFQVESTGGGKVFDEVMTAAWSLDGRWLAMARGSGFMELRDGETFEPIATIEIEQCHPLDLAFHPTKSLLAIGSRQGEIVLQPFNPVEAPQRLLAPGAAGFVRWNASGTKLAATASTEDVVVWFDVDTGALLRTVAAPKDGRKTFGLSDDATLAVSWVDRSTLRVYDAWTGAEVGVCSGVYESSSAIERAVFSSRGNRFVVTSRSKVATMWDVSGSPNEWTFETGDATLSSAAVSPDGRSVAAGTVTGRIHLFCTPAGVLGRVLLGHSSHVDDVAFDPDSSLLASVSKDGTARVWDLATGECRWKWGTPGEAAMTIAWSRDGSRLFWAGASGVIEVRDVETGKLLDSWTGHAAVINDLTLSPDGRTLASGGGWQKRDEAVDSVVRLWSVATGDLLHELRGHDQSVLCVAWSPDGRLVTAGARSFGSNSLQSWSATTGERIPMRASVDRNSVYDLVWLGPSRLLVASADQTVHLEDFERRRELFSFRGMRGGVNQIAVDPDGRYFVATGSSELRIFDRRSPLEAVASHTVRRLGRRFFRREELRAAVVDVGSLDEAERAKALAMVEGIEEDPSTWVRRAMKSLQRNTSPPNTVDWCLHAGLAAHACVREDGVDWPWGAYTVALARVRRGEFEEALVSLDEAGLADAPWDEGRLDDAGLRSLILIGLGRLEEAKALFDEAERAIADAPEGAKPRASTTLLREAAQHWRGLAPAEADAP